MSARTLKRLVGALAVVVVLWLGASLLSRGGGPPEISGDIATLFDGLNDSTVTAVRIARPEGRLELRRADGSWKVNGFQSDSGSVARFFQTLSEMKVADLAATNPSNHERMGVAEDSARTLEIDVGDSTRTIMVGKEGPRFSTAYARLPGEDEVYLLEGGLRSHLTRRLDDWRNRKMVAIDTSRVARLAVERGDDAFTLVRADSSWTFEDGAPTNSTQVGSILDQLAGGLVASRFVADDDSIAALPRGGSTVAYSDSGEALVEVDVGSGTGDTWGTVVGDSVRYRLPSFRVNLITPTLESVRPRS